MLFRSGFPACVDEVVSAWCYKLVTWASFKTTTFTASFMRYTQPFNIAGPRVLSLENCERGGGILCVCVSVCVFVSLPDCCRQSGKLYELC